MTAPGSDLGVPFDLRFCLVREPQAGARPIVQAPGEAFEVLRSIVPAHDDGREVFGFLALSARHRLIGCHVVSVGCLTASLVHPREVFAPAFACKAASLVLWHTHPSLDVEPSPEDLALTRRLAAAGALLGVEIVDHLVVAADGSKFLSLKNRGVL